MTGGSGVKHSAISDLDARRTALDPQRSFIVQAPAGSGKTGLLVYRMLTLLASVEKPQQVLAITFTRKATAEMRERLLQLIECAERGQHSDDAFEQQGIDLAVGVLAQDKKHNWRLLDAPHQLQILTIDSFCAKLTGSMPWLSRLGDRPHTTDQAHVHYSMAIEQLFAELLDDQSRIAPALTSVMLELDFNYNKARQLFSSMLAKRDQWLRHLLQGDLASMRDQLEHSWQNIVDAQLSNISEILPQASTDELCQLAVYAAHNSPLKEGVTPPLKVFLEYQQGNHLNANHWRALGHMLLSGDNFRKRVNKNMGFEAKHANTNRMHEVLAEFADDWELLTALNEIKTLPSASFDDADWQQLLALEKVLKSLAALLQLRFRATGECDHSEVTQRANLALQELDRPTDLGLRMDYHLQHILVDEFQDTSHGQIELLKKLTAGWADSNELKTVFLVGDPMQSIYRFREADVSLFLQVTDNANTHIFPGLNIGALNLTQNFRSTNSLVTWFNTTFQSSFPKRNNVLSGAIKYAQASCSKSDNEPACDYFLAYDRDQEASLVLSSVVAEISALPSRRDQVAILVRTRPQLDYLLPKLQSAGIAYAGIDIQPLADLQAVIDLLTLCKAICREDDRVAWLALLRGPWCGLSLCDIKHLVGRQDCTVWAQLQSADISQLSDQHQRNLGRFTEQMNLTMAQRQQVSLASLARWAWLGLGGEHTLLGASRDDIETVFGLISELEQGGDLPSMRDLDNALKGLYAEPQNGDAGDAPQVVVSTMHKSKGLQYHTVILPGLANPPRNSDKEVLMWAEAQNSSGESDLLLAPFTDQGSASDNASDSLHYHYLRHLDAKRSANEAIRLMYVATTRAEKKLVLIGRAKLDPKSSAVRPPTKSTLLATVWNALESKFTFPLAEPTERDDSEAISQTLTRLPSDFFKCYRESIQWQVTQQLNSAPKVPEDSVVVEYQWATEVATGVGIVLHDWLQYNGAKVLSLEIGPSLVQRWRAELLNLRVPYSSLDYALQRLVVAVKNIQSHKEAHFLFENYPESQNEFTLSALENGSVNKYRLDRTFVDHQHVRWIVDYKSTAHDNDDVAEFAAEQVRSRHKAQLEKYGFLFSQVDARPIQLAVYFPLLKQLISWPYEASNH
ncbi:MAG: ATP-dependent exoDNAse (exonuclease V) beta subunit [Arenicella sp.]|jgi:ATP-dependent exoDNAse (exonuclease V) beta subunit